MANHYLIWVEKYGKEEADKREIARRDKLRAINLQKAALKPKKEAVKKEKKPRTGKNNGMYGKTVLGIWIEKYGKEIAERKWKEFCSKRGKNLKKTMQSMSQKDRSKKYGTFGDENASRRPEVKKTISNKIAAYWADTDKSDSQRKRSSARLTHNNPSKQLGASERISKHRKEYYSNPENRKKTSERMSKIHEEGKGGSGYTKNYKYLDKSGKEHIVQGSYELAFIKWLDLNNMKFRCHEDRIKYIDSEGIERTYLPDFFVEEWNSYVDVKSSYWYSVQKDKFVNIFQSNPDLPLKILLESDLMQMNILN